MLISKDNMARCGSSLSFSWWLYNWVMDLHSRQKSLGTQLWTGILGLSHQLQTAEEIALEMFSELGQGC